MVSTQYRSVLHEVVFYKSSMFQDPANRTTEDHYTQLQAKVAEIVCIDNIEL